MAEDLEQKERKSVLGNLDILKHKIFVDDEGKPYFIYHIERLRNDPAGIGLLVQYEDRQRKGKLFTNILSHPEALDPPEDLISELEITNGIKYLNRPSKGSDLVAGFFGHQWNGRLDNYRFIKIENESYLCEFNEDRHRVTKFLDGEVQGQYGGLHMGKVVDKWFDVWIENYDEAFRD